ncbi:TRL domain-containing protein [Leptospira sp. 96542]|nr:TRL domain-containing protein [Leptospira sp. 96542]
MVGFVMFNCAIAGPGYGITPGGLFSSAAMNKDISTATDVGGKTGEACAFSILSLIAFGDGSIKSAQEDGGIKVVKAVDYRYTNVMSFFSSVCTIARGD